MIPGIVAGQMRGGSTSASFDSLILGYSPSGYWKLSETTGSVATDSSGNARHGTYVGSPAFSQTPLFGSSTRSTRFDASSYVTIPDSALLSGASARTVGLFVSIDDISAGIRFLMSYGAASNGAAWALEVGRGGNGSFGVNMQGTGWLFSSTSGLFSNSQPLLLVAVYTGSRVQCYVNGTQVVDEARASAATSAASGAIGRRTYTTALPVVGAYSNAFILPIGLNASQVSALWDARNI